MSHTARSRITLDDDDEDLGVKGISLDYKSLGLSAEAGPQAEVEADRSKSDTEGEKKDKSKKKHKKKKSSKRRSGSSDSDGGDASNDSDGSHHSGGRSGQVSRENSDGEREHKSKKKSDKKSKDKSHERESKGSDKEGKDRGKSRLDADHRREKKDRDRDGERERERSERAAERRAKEAEMLEARIAEVRAKKDQDRALEKQRMAELQQQQVEAQRQMLLLQKQNQLHSESFSGSRGHLLSDVDDSPAGSQSPAVAPYAAVPKMLSPLDADKYSHYATAADTPGGKQPAGHWGPKGVASPAPSGHPEFSPVHGPEGPAGYVVSEVALGYPPDSARDGLSGPTHIIEDGEEALEGGYLAAYPGVYDPPISKKLGEPIIVCDHVLKDYTIKGRGESVRALSNIHLAPGSEFYPIRRGEFVMLRGPSGGGKTTLLNIIGTLDKPTGGTLDLLGKRVDNKSTDSYLSHLRLQKIGFVFQTFNLLASMSAFENVELPMTVLGKISKKERRKRAKELLTMVGLRDRMMHLPSELSGGEQQRVTIARALCNNPEILLLDEPTGDLDTRNTVEIMDLLLEINLRNKTTMLMVTHNPDVELYADRILYLADGKLARQVLNSEQNRLIYDEYVQYLNKQGL